MRCLNNGCGKKFYKEKNFKSHSNKCHYKDRKFKCNFNNCLKSFSKIGNLRKHKVMHQEKKINPCTFENCKEVLTSIYSFNVILNSQFNFLFSIFPLNFLIFNVAIE